MNIDTFSQLHHNNAPLLLCNVWDAPSAIAATYNQFSAMGTSSAAIANMLGYEDGENLPLETLLLVVKRILSVSELPLTVDIESGFSSDASEVAALITGLAQLGVVGVNIEDSNVENGKRDIKSADVLAEFLSTITAQLEREQTQIFINVRTDTYILDVKNKLSETIKRADLYKKAGANGLFVPCITALSEIENIVRHIELPLNVMCMPELTSFKALGKSGVKRISMGNVVFDNQTQYLTEQLGNIKRDGQFNSLF